MGKNKKLKLNENDCKNTLSSMKKPKPPKTVLINNITDYWPALNDQQMVKFQELMESFLNDKSNKDHVSIGLESTLRNVKNGIVKCLLIAEEIAPQWFGKHLIAMTLTKDPTTKILILPKMKDATKKLLNVPSIMCAVKKDVEPLNEFYKSLNIHDELLRHFYTVRPNTDTSIPKKKKTKPEIEIPPIVYLKKSESAPAFTSVKPPEKMEFEDSANFISLAKYDDPNFFKKKPPLPAYRPLKVKKIIGNSNRKSKDS